MSIEIFITFLAASAALIFVPGPTTLLIAHYALIHGKGVGKYTIPAVALGDMIALAITFSGLGALIEKYPQGLFVLKLVGGIYLCGLGLLAIFAPKDLNDAGDIGQHVHIKKIFLHILVITSFNPESIIFLLAFFAQFLDINASTTSQLLIMGITYIIIGISASIAYTMAADKIRLATRSIKFRKAINLFTGLLLCSFGLMIIFS